MNNEQRNALFGKSSTFSEHKEGDIIRFRVGGQEKQGKILHVRAPGPAIIGGKEHPLLYIVDTSEGFPVKVLPSQIIESSVTATITIASYGYPMDDMVFSRAAAVKIAEAAPGKIIRDHGKRWRVLSAELDEHNETHGLVVALCEEAGQDEEVTE